MVGCIDGSLKAGWLDGFLEWWVFDGWLDCRRMQDAGAERRQFGGLDEADVVDWPRLWNDSRVARHHTFDIGPDLDFVGAECGAEQGRGVVGSAAAQRSRQSILGGADVALRDDRRAAA